MASAGSRFQAFMNHPAGPKTVFFWAPMMKWALVLAGIKDLSRPAEKLSVSQNFALALTGMIWVRYCFVITPVNYPLAAVNFFVGTNGLVQLGRIAHIGRNFADHAKELNNAVPTEPFFFLKPTSSYIGNGDSIEIPKGVVAHHEVELAVVIGSKARDVSPAKADSYIGGYALAIDMTARNMQDKAKKSGLPWSAAKGLDTFTPISSLVDKSLIPDPHNVDLWLSVDGEIRQRGNTSDMIFNIPDLIVYTSSIMTLEEGDVLLTGTPKGVSALHPGNQVRAGLQLPGESRILAELSLGVKERNGAFTFRG
ncbi:acylpyruvate hydrolase [Malassezia cuniculi]|uniref:Acylpyruvate hydrolase n=1 Tax=Malassezia cuniculi TaxID=948313 RepID=A0AAF0EWZ0_9BASI|nr:acylpyruvate hydrolase [Malassezia cuniculi]